jgi:hypothetical protein
MLKSNKDLRSKLNSSFRSGLISGKGKGVIWGFLSYSPKEAKEHIESQFVKGMTWQNHGKSWHIDHIIPQAALPYLDPHSKKFAKCWELKNLRPLFIRENSQKSSRYKNILHRYNDIDLNLV